MLHANLFKYLTGMRGLRHLRITVSDLEEAETISRLIFWVMSTVSAVVYFFYYKKYSTLEEFIHTFYYNEFI